MEILKTIITIIFVIDCIALSAIIASGREVCRSWNNQRGSRFLLGTEQRTFYGRCTCKVYKVPGNFVYSFGCGFEPQCI